MNYNKNMLLNRKAFTFVELIVVLVIIAILSTIWFTVYESYLSSWRDTNRVLQLKDINSGLSIYGTKSKLPLPEGAISITAWSNIISYQWNLSSKIIKAISYNGWWKDPDFDVYPVYTLSSSKRDFQLMTFVEDAETLLLQAPIDSVNADVNYSVLFPKVIWSPLGTILDSSTQDPLQDSETLVTNGSYDILTWTGELRVYYSDTEFFDTSWWDILDILPNRTCKRISELWNASWNWEYTIVPDGVIRKRVYCDMEVNGWWWMLVWRSVSWWSTSDFGWIYETGSIKDDSSPYSYGSWSRIIDFDQILIAPYTSWKNINFAASYNVNSQYFRDNYNLQSSSPESSSYTSWLNTCTYQIAHPTDTTPTHCSTYEKRYWGKFWYTGFVVARNTSEEYGLRWSGTSFNGADEYSWDQAMIFIR